MSVSKKPKNNEYIDSTGVVHNRKKLSEYLTSSTGSASLDSTYIDTAEANSWSRFGNIVVFTFTLKTKGTWNNTTIFARNLPKPKTWGRFLALDTSNGDKPMRCALTNDGELRNWYSSTTPPANHIIEGSFVYVAAN